MKVVDANVFIHHAIPDGDLATVPAVIEEIRNRLSATNVKPMLPSKTAVKTVTEAAKRTGDIYDLSEVDIKVVALAFDKKMTLVTDDYSMQNVCEELNVPWEGAAKKGIAKKWKWKLVCTGCGRDATSAECEICGSPTKRKPVFDSNQRDKPFASPKDK